MTLTESSPAPQLTLRGWDRAAFKPLAPILPAQPPVGPMTDARPLTGRNNAVANSRRGSAAVDIATADWDLLFRAVLELLARVVLDKPVPDGSDVRLQVQGTALRECVDALDQLRRSVPPRSSQQMDRLVCNEGEIAPHLPAAASGAVRCGQICCTDASTGSAGATAPP